MASHNRRERQRHDSAPEAGCQTRPSNHGGIRSHGRQAGAEVPNNGKHRSLDKDLVISKLFSMGALVSSSLLTAVASPRRREILRLIWTEEQTAGAIHRAMPDVTFGAVSLQLRSLAGAGLVDARAEGRHRFYRARHEALGPVARMLEQMWDDALWRLKLAAELEQTRRGPRSRRRPRKG